MSENFNNIYDQLNSELRYMHPISLDTVEDVLTYEPDLDEYFESRMEDMDDIPDYSPFAYVAINREGSVRTLGLGVVEEDVPMQIMDGRLDRPTIRQEHVPKWMPEIEENLEHYAEQGELRDSWNDTVLNDEFSLTANETRYF